MINNILIDLDDTILDFHKAERIAVKKSLEHFSIDATKEVIDRYHILNIEQWKKLEKGLINREEVKVNRYKNLFTEIGIPQNQINTMAEETAKYYEKMLAVGHYFIPGAEEFLIKYSKNFNLYLVSNGTSSVQHSRIKSANIERYFKKIYISEDIGLTKPSKEFFDYCFKDIGKRNESLIIGDSLTSDILGGINACIKTIWFNPSEETNETPILPDYEIKKLSDLQNAIDKFDEE